jgi:hypothetical protein
MPYQPGQGKTAVALFVDGLELKYVQLSMKGKKVTLRDFRTAPLVTKFEEKQAAAMGGDDTGMGDIGADAFAAPPAMPTEGEGGENSNATVLLSILGDLPMGKYTVSYALSEPSVSYQEFDSDFGLKGSKLKKKVIEELASTRSAPPPPDAVATIPTVRGGLLTVVREDGIHLFDLLTEIKPFLNNRIPTLDTMDSADLGMMGLVRASYDLQDEEVSVIVYVGNEFSRIIFMQGREYLHIAPIISEGYQSPNIENTIYSRILLEQDNIALARLDRILLAGESHKLNLRESLAPQFSSATVDYLQSPELDLSMFEGEVGEAISEYAIPIATAWRVLEPKHKGFYNVNVLPVTIAEGQKALGLAWHGWLLAALLLFSIVFFYTSIMSRNAEIRRAKDVLARKQTELEDLKILQNRREELKKDIQRYNLAAAVYDTIVPGADRWSRILHYVGTSVDDLNSLWIYSIAKADQPEGALIIRGRSIYRTRIPRLTSIFEKATLRSVRTTTIRDKTIYDFDILVEQVDKADERPPAPARPTTRRRR